MLKAVHLIILYSLSLTTYSQKFSVSNEANNTAYVHLPNPIKIAVERYSCNSLLITTDNGRIEGNKCTYTFYPENIGAAKIIIKSRINGKVKKIGEYVFRILDLPLPYLKIGPFSGGTAKRAVFANQQFVRTEDSNPACYDVCNFQIDSFNIQITNNKNVVFEHTNIGNKLDDSVVNAFHNLLDKDIVFITKIMVTGGDGKQRQIYPVQFTIFE